MLPKTACLNDAIRNNQKNNIIFMLKLIWVFFLPTYGEGMPISVLEAMAYGLPVVTRQVGGLNDFFINEKMGFITKSKSPKVFSDFLIRLIEDSELRKAMAEYNKKYAYAHFSATKVTKRFYNICRLTLRN